MRVVPGRDVSMSVAGTKVCPRREPYRVTDRNAIRFQPGTREDPRRGRGKIRAADGGGNGRARELGCSLTSTRDASIQVRLKGASKQVVS